MISFISIFGYLDRRTITTAEKEALKIYRKIPIISPGLIFVQKDFCWAHFRGSLFSGKLIFGGACYRKEF